MTHPPPSPLLGEAQVRKLQSDGWDFEPSGIRLGDSWAVWAQRAGVHRCHFLADPDRYPAAWGQRQIPEHL